MRKQDRIANQQQQDRPQEPPTKPSSQPERKEAEQVKGSATQARPERQPGKLPLPD